jgi:Rieske Fe-S protein
MFKNAIWFGFAFLILGANAQAATKSKAAVDVLKVQAKIQQSKALWQAKNSWVTKLSTDEIKRMLGLKELPKGQLDFESVGSLGAGYFYFFNIFIYIQS